VEVPIIGRGQELAQVRAALVAASVSGGRLVLVSGEPGIGKTRLTAAIAEMAGEYEVPVASGYAIDDPGMPPLWPWRRLGGRVPALAGAFGAAGGPADTAGAGGTAGAAGGPAGTAGAVGGPAGTAGAADTAAARFGMFAEASQALADAAAGSGLLVVLEDLQWADRTSLLLLRHLAGELARTRLLVVGTFRDSADTRLAELLPDLLRADGTQAIRLTGLSRRDIAEWLRRVRADGDTGRLAGRLAERTGGNPLFVRMIVERGVAGIEHGLGEYPELRQLVLGRLSPPGDPVRELLDAASVLGERVDLRLLASVAGLSGPETGALLDQAVGQGVLRAAPDTAGLAFAHALVRDAVYDELPPSRRMALHEQAARALERSWGSAAAGPIATHWRRSGDPDWAAHCVRWAREAARSATASLAYDEAARFAALALDAAETGAVGPGAGGPAPGGVQAGGGGPDGGGGPGAGGGPGGGGAQAGGPDGGGPGAGGGPGGGGLGLRAELTLDAARAEFAAGHIEASVARCQAAARLGEEAGRPDIVAASALVITGMGDPATNAAVDALCASAIRAVPAGDTTLRARLLARQAIFAAETGACHRARELSAESLALASQSEDPDALLDGIHARHLSLSAPQFLAERRELAARACEVAQRARQPLAELWGHVWLVDAAFQAGDLAAVDHELGRIEQLALNGKHSLAWWHLHRLRATRAALTGELDAALAHNEQAREVAARIGAISTIGMYYAFLGQMALLRGTIDRDLADMTLGMLRQVPDLPLVRVFIPMTYVLLGERDLARATFEEFRYMPGMVEVGPRWAALLGQIGVVAVSLDDVGTADRVYRELSGLGPMYMGDGSGAVFSGGSLQRLIGDLALATGRVDEAIRRYTDAIAMNARIGARPFLALSRLGLARALAARAQVPGTQVAGAQVASAQVASAQVASAQLAGADPGDLSAARALVTEAAGEFRRLDLPGPLATADALLAGIDAAARAASPLSPRESEIATLIASAMSNRQIAQQLVLSERTVETHVRSILAKLGFSSRTEVATWSLRATRLGSARAVPRLPLRAGDPVHHPVAAILGDRADVRPADPLEDGPHGYVGGIGRRLDGLGGRVTEQPVGQQDERLPSVALAAGVRAQADPYLVCPAGNRAAGGHEGLDPPDRHPVQVNGQIEPAIVHPARPPEAGTEAGLVGEFGDGHGISGGHGMPFRIDLRGSQGAQGQPLAVNPHFPRAWPIVLVHRVTVGQSQEARRARCLIAAQRRVPHRGPGSGQAPQALTGVKCMQLMLTGEGEPV
jgi:DNA-binding CsgD family transcriptional regulator/tetratricopeptide (TPR) repeat protein